MDKKLLRDKIIRQIRDLTLEEKITSSQRICREMINSPDWQKKDILFAYYPFGNEIDILPLLNNLWEQNEIPLALPFISGNQMDFYPVDRENRNRMVLNKWGIWEPRPEGKILKPESFSCPLMILPGLAFTLTGKRLGRGGGYYDRYLDRNSHFLNNVKKWAAAYPCQIRDDIPTESHDIILDKVFY